MAGKGTKKARRATAGQEEAMRQVLSGMQPDTEGTAALDAVNNCSMFLAGDLPDEEKEAIRKVDFSVLERRMEGFTVFPDETVQRMDHERLVRYACQLGAALLSCQDEYLRIAEQLANAQELFLNGRNALFGRSTQRFSAIAGRRTGEADGKGRCSEGNGGPGNTDNQDIQDIQDKDPQGAQNPQGDPVKSPASPDEGDGKQRSKGTPRRSRGCADRVCRNAQKNNIDVTIGEDVLNDIFGTGNWEDIPGAEVIVNEYKVIPAKVVVNVYHLHKYRAIDTSGINGPECVTAKSPVERVRDKSRMSASLLGYMMYGRNSLRMPVERVCSHLGTLGLDLTPQQAYENQSFYDRYFSILQERQWVLLLNSHNIQIDETPVRYYDRVGKKVKRGYMWVFTSGEMSGGKKITLFYFAQGRGAQVLRECLSGFTGVIGSDGHSAYHVFARESGGAVINAGCLDHFRKRVVAALRAVPGLEQMTEEEKRKIPAYVIMERLAKVFKLERKVRELETKAEREAFREGYVREAFEALVKETLDLEGRGHPEGSYMANVIRYMKNQEVYLEEFLKNGDIASNNTNCERKFAFFSVLRNQIKMFGSFRGAQIAGHLEGLEQTARQYVKNTRIYYQFLFERLIAFVKKVEKSNADGGEDWANAGELDRFMPWSEEYLEYEASVLAEERQAVLPASR